MPRVYKHYFWNSERWDGFKHRDGDVIICSSYRAGTTWMQRICSLLILESPDLYKPLTEISPWMELEAHPVEKIHADYEAQTHQRFIKTHTPFDGLPYREGSRYIFVGRDPRDIFVSLYHHLRNINPESSRRLLEKSGREPVPPRGKAPDDFSSLLDEWLFHGCFPWEDNGWPYWSVFSHASSFWEQRHLPNILFIHYDELQANLAKSMSRISNFIGVKFDESKNQELVEAARFDRMKADADLLAPDLDWGAWEKNATFFNHGISNQWKSTFSAEEKSKYLDVVQGLVSTELNKWLHNEVR